jgi:hypothetical protein
MRMAALILLAIIKLFTDDIIWIYSTDHSINLSSSTLYLIPVLSVQTVRYCILPNKLYFLY